MFVDNKFAVLVGSPGAGFQVVGPFDERDDALALMDRLERKDCWLMPFTSPEEILADPD